MARPNAPWYLASRGTWWVKIRGKLTSLKVKGRENEAAAWAAFRALLDAPDAAPTPTPAPAPVPPPPPPLPDSVREAAEQFFATHAANLKPKTVTRYRDDMRAFVRAHGDTPLAAVTPHQITGWFTAIKGVCTTQAIMLSSVSAFLGWCVREGKLATNPVTRVRRPRTASRSDSTVISDEVHQRLLAGASPEFGDVLTVLHGTGCRPGEVGKITAQSLQTAARMALIYEHKTDRTGKPRRVVFTPPVLALLVDLSKRYPTGPLLRSRKGKGWTGPTITSAMWNLSRKVGVKAVAYGYRHKFVTEGLMSGISNAIMASLVGHTSTAVIDRFYSHLGAAGDVMRDALKFRERGGVNGSANSHPSSPPVPRLWSGTVDLPPELQFPLFQSNYLPPNGFGSHTLSDLPAIAPDRPRSGGTERSL